MRTLMIAGILAILAAPLGARADVRLRLVQFDAVEGPASHLRVGVPLLRIGSENLRVDEGSGAGGGRVEPALALILGIFPGFGLGHYVAGSPRWTSWLVIDVVLLVAAIVVSAADGGALTAIAWIATVVERVIEGIDAFGAAGGRLSRSTAPGEALAARAAVGAAAAEGPSRAFTRDAWALAAVRF